MDNNFENDFNTALPQRPFTEKAEPADVPAQNPPFDFQPEKPFMQNSAPVGQQPAPEPEFQQPVPEPRQPFNAIPPQNEQSFNYAPPVNGANTQAPGQQAFNPIEHTATYAGNRFVNRQYPPQQVPPAQTPDMPGYGYPQTGAQAYPDTRGFDGAPGRQPGYGNYPGYNIDSNPYRQNIRTNPEPPKKSKANKGLVIVIIVLSILLAASMVGIAVFAFKNGGKQSSSDISNGIPGIDYTLPSPDEYGIPQPDSKQTPEEKHSESDYSDKTNADFKGISLGELPSNKDDSKYGSEYVYSNVSDAVVGIECYLDDESSVDAQGTGTVITSDGYVLTNAHVIGNSKKLYSIKVIDSNNKKYNAGVVGFDTRTDLAVLKLDGAKDLKTVEFGNSDTLKLGEDIFIVGNPGGIEFKNSLTKGIVSALNRDASSKSIVKYIQTDAAINPGNSGGPAVNKYGQVVGIASSKIVDEKYEGMAFCIPSTTVKTIVDSLIKNGYVQGRVKIGISGYAVTSDTASQYDVPTGICAETVASDGPCGKAGVKAGEIITEFDGTKISSFAEIYNKLEEHKSGDKVKIKVYNTDTKQEREVEITLQEDK